MEQCNVLRLDRTRDGRFAYRCTLRNERIFKIGDRVFFATSRYNNDFLCVGHICGISIEYYDGNPEYRYDVRVADTAAAAVAFGLPLEEGEVAKRLDCATIFYTVKDAKRSALECAKHKYAIEKKAIENFFKQFAKEGEVVNNA